MWGKAAIAGVATCAVLATGGAASASHGADGGPRDFAVGAAQNTFAIGGGEADLRVSAHGFGSDVTGHVRGSGNLVGEFRVEGEVTCLRVVGNRAAIKYRFKTAQGPGAPPENGGVQVFVEDNGEPRNGQAVDRNSTDFPQPPAVFELAAHRCDDPTTRLEPEWNPVDSGNYVVHDAG